MIRHILSSSLLYLQIGHVLNRAHMPVLVIGKNEQDVRFLALGEREQSQSGPPDWMHDF
jgi:hypothetical protein